MYSGTGTAIYDWIRFAKKRFDFALMMDPTDPDNFEHAATFCRANDVEFLPSSALPLPGCVDFALPCCAQLLANRAFDVVESVSWANAAANILLLNCLPDATVLVYTPHTQPVWTVGERGDTLSVRYVFRLVLQRADVVLIDSFPELQLDLFADHHNKNVFEVPLGVDTERFKNTGKHLPKAVLSVCDFREQRKRADLLLAAFSTAVELAPDLTFTLIGRASDTLELPRNIVPRTTRLGYVSSDDLVTQYQSAAIYALMSDYEAFGLPIAEALCSGTQVVLNRQDTTFALFGELPGVYITTNTDVAATAQVLVNASMGNFDPEQISSAAAVKFSFESTYGKKLSLIEAALQSKTCRSST
jgi:glycosyltransferase involved in cell wall biosynthesis